jgi:hypothetical protein
MTATPKLTTYGQETGPQSRRPIEGPFQASSDPHMGEDQAMFPSSVSTRT